MTRYDGPEQQGDDAPPRDRAEHDSADEPGLPMDGSGPQELTADEE
jgi:hypothetical protein